MEIQTVWICADSWNSEMKFSEPAVTLFLLFLFFWSASIFLTQASPCSLSLGAKGNLKCFPQIKRPFTIALKLVFFSSLPFFFFYEYLILILLSWKSSSPIEPLKSSMKDEFEGAGFLVIISSEKKGKKKRGKKGWGVGGLISSPVAIRFYLFL